MQATNYMGGMWVITQCIVQSEYTLKSGHVQRAIAWTCFTPALIFLLISPSVLFSSFAEKPRYPRPAHKAPVMRATLLNIRYSRLSWR